MFYLTTHSTPFIYCYMASDIWLREREREMFYITTHSTHFIYGYMASDIWLRTILIVRRETHCRHIGFSYQLTATRNSSMGPPHEGSIRRPIAPWANALPLSYVPLPYWDGRPPLPPLSYFSFHPVLHNWCNNSHGMCYPVCGMVHIKEPVLLIGKSSLCGGSGFPFFLSEWSLTICLMPYNRK